MSIKSKLIETYSQHWQNLKSALNQLPKERYTNPFLISFDDETYKAADLKVMIFGQEPWSWGHELGNADDPLELIGLYERFFQDEQFYDGYEKSAFWQAFRFFKENLEAEHPLKNIYFSYNNINKIGKGDGKTGVNQDVRKIERDLFPVVKEEVGLFDPDIIIFLTGPSRDADIKYHFGNVDFLPISDNIAIRALAKLQIPTLSAKCVRLYHPGARGRFHAIKAAALNYII